MENQEFDNSLMQGSDLALYDLINDSNFEQFIDLIRGETVDANVNCMPNYDESELMFGNGIVDSQLYPAPGDPFNFNSTTTSEPSSLLNSLPAFSGDIELGDGENDEDDSSANNTTTTKGGTTGDRSRTLVSERKRRSRMKEKLYALRSLVPNITKMDKASIVGDAVSYVQDLQRQAKTIKAEIAGLEGSLNGGGKFQTFVKNSNQANNVREHKLPFGIKMLQIDVFQMEEKEYYVRLACTKGEGVAVALHKALESLSSFDIKNSNFTTNSDKFVFTFTVDVKECGEEMSLSTLKLWVTGALLNHGFDIKTL